MRSCFLPACIISGGQTGVDRAALDAAIAAGLPHGGCCPAGRLAEDGRIPDVYQLTELTSRGYPDRTRQNVVDADATLILHIDALGSGTALTRRFCKQLDKPLQIVSLAATKSPRPLFPSSVANLPPAAQITHWLNELRPPVLNIAGPRESGSPGIQVLATETLGRVFAGAVK